jgi:hypothetical protein
MGIGEVLLRHISKSKYSDIIPLLEISEVIRNGVAPIIWDFHYPAHSDLQSGWVKI